MVNGPITYIVTQPADPEADPQVPELSQSWTVTVSNAVTEIVQLDILETGSAVHKEVNSFYGRDYRNPRATLISNGLRLWRGPKYLIQSLVIDHINAPSVIESGESGGDDVILWWPNSAKHKIIDYAVEYLRLTVEDPSWQANMQDMQTNTHNPSVGR